MWKSKTPSSSLQTYILLKYHVWLREWNLLSYRICVKNNKESGQMFSNGTAGNFFTSQFWSTAKAACSHQLRLWKALNIGQCLWWLFRGPFPASTCAAPGMSFGFRIKPYHYPTKPSTLQRQGDIKYSCLLQLQLGETKDPIMRCLGKRGVLFKPF